MTRTTNAFVTVRGRTCHLYILTRLHIDLLNVNGGANELEVVLDLPVSEPVGLGSVVDGLGVLDLAAGAEHLEREVVLVLLSDVLVHEERGDAGPDDGPADGAGLDDVGEGLLAQVSRACRRGDLPQHCWKSRHCLLIDKVHVEDTNSHSKSYK